MFEQVRKIATNVEHEAHAAAFTRLNLVHKHTNNLMTDLNTLAAVEAVETPTDANDGISTNCTSMVEGSKASTTIFTPASSQLACSPKSNVGSNDTIAVMRGYRAFMSPTTATFPPDSDDSLTVVSSISGQDSFIFDGSNLSTTVPTNSTTTMHAPASPDWASTKLRAKTLNLMIMAGRRLLYCLLFFVVFCCIGAIWFEACHRSAACAKTFCDNKY